MSRSSGNVTRNKEIVKKIKSQGCKNCGIKYNLTFHHRNQEEKKYKVSDLVSRGYGLERLMTEINKCDVLCDICHDEVHGVFRKEHRRL